MSRLHIGNLCPTTTAATLTAALQQDGRKFARVQLVMTRDEGRSRGFAFVDVEPGEDCTVALGALQGREVDGRPITVAIAHGPKSRFGLEGNSSRTSSIRPLK